MKLLFFTDTHIRGTAPRSRTDNFYYTLKQKFYEIVEISQENHVDYILHGGDWFDRPDISPAIVREFAVILQSFERPIYTVAGNHDLFGYNPDTLGRTMLGLLEGVGILNILQTGEKVFLEKQGVKMQLSGSSYHFDIDSEGVRRYYLVEKNKDAAYAVHIVHGMLLHKPFLEEVSYTLLEDIAETEADVTLSGHYHSGFGIKQIGDKYFINPGSMVRTAGSFNEINRKPKVVIMALDEKISIKEIELKSAKPGEEVFDKQGFADSIERKLKLQEFYNTLSMEKECQSMDIHEVIEKIVRNRALEDAIKKEALRRIGEARENLSSGGEES